MASSFNFAVADVEEGFDCVTTIEPNNLQYTDGNGDRHEIYIPGGKFAEVSDHYIKGHWEELAKYPRWGT